MESYAGRTRQMNMRNREEKHSSQVSVYRVCAMLMIFVGHFVNAYEIAAVSQMLIVGVEMFLFLSGWLYGDKKIENPGTWLWRRFLRVCVPASVWSMIAGLLYALIDGSYPSMSQVIVSLLNLQGLGRIVNISVSSIPLAHLWFVTIIMLCYMAVPLLDRWTSREITPGNIWQITILVGVLVALLCYAGIRLASLFCFLLGYFMKRAHVTIRGRSYCVLTLFVLGISVFRLLCRHYIDGTVLYDEVITLYNRIALAVWLFYSLLYLEENTTIINHIAHRKLFSVLEKTNYYIYLTHYMFVAGNFSVMHYIASLPLQIAMYIVLTAICTLIMYWLDSAIQIFMRETEHHIGRIKK